MFCINLFEKHALPQCTLNKHTLVYHVNSYAYLSTLPFQEVLTLFQFLVFIFSCFQSFFGSPVSLPFLFVLYVGRHTVVTCTWTCSTHDSLRPHSTETWHSSLILYSEVKTPLISFKLSSFRHVDKIFGQKIVFSFLSNSTLNNRRECLHFSATYQHYNTPPFLYTIHIHLFSNGLNHTYGRAVTYILVLLNVFLLHIIKLVHSWIGRSKTSVQITSIWESLIFSTQLYVSEGTPHRTKYRSLPCQNPLLKLALECKLLWLAQERGKSLGSACKNCRVLTREYMKLQYRKHWQCVRQLGTDTSS